jgi:hypothetical protein
MTTTFDLETSSCWISSPVIETKFDQRFEVPELPELAPVRLTKGDAAIMAKDLGEEQARWLVDTYYQLQEFRKVSGQQVMAARASIEPSSALRWTYEQMAATEASIRRIMEEWTNLSLAGQWAKSTIGIGPVLAAGVVATFTSDTETVGSWWRFAGVDPTLEWKKGQKRPYNAKAKLLMWKIGDSFVKVSGKENAFYGQVYRQRKAYELKRETDGGNKFTATLTLGQRDIRDPETKKIYESGHLPAGRLDLRARRYAAKLWLAHFHEVTYFLRHNKMPPKPYVIEHLGHTDWIGAPNVDVIPGLREAEEAAGMRRRDTNGQEQRTP